MFEAAELGRKTSKSDYKKQEPILRVGLLTVQYELRPADFPVIVVLGGDDGFGCTEVANLLHEWMDPRYLRANVFERPSQEEAERPRFYRYWRSLPAKGYMGLYLREWTTRAILDRVLGTIDGVGLDRRLGHIQNFERALADDGAVMLKFWLHMPKSALKKRLKAAAKKKGLAWSVSKEDKLVYKHYDAVREVAEKVLRRTSRGRCLWNILESTDSRYRDVTVAQIVIAALTKRLAQPVVPRAERPHRPSEVDANPLTVLDRVDLTQSLTKEDYENELRRLWNALARSSRKAHREGIASVFVFEGWDAAGKGGVIRRVTRAMDAAHYRVLRVAAPAEEERSFHYLWRFWRNLPRAGHASIFDRSWYGRVLVERLEGLASDEEWSRAYSEINDFEEQLTLRGILVVKFWIHIDAEEQLRRFKKRETVPFKKYKITPDDYRNRERWADYEIAADEMIQRTSTDYAKWHLIAGNDKRWARIEVLKRVCHSLQDALEKSRPGSSSRAW